MQKIADITPEELFFLGKLLQGEYIDYDYIASMEDIGKHYAEKEQEAHFSLAQKELVQEDFCGDAFVTEKGKAAEPVFFGKCELRAEVLGPGGDTKLLDIRFHIREEQAVMSFADRRVIRLWALPSAEIPGALLRSLNLPEKETPDILRDHLPKDTDRVIVVSCSAVGKETLRCVWYEQKEQLFRFEEPEGTQVEGNGIEAAIRQMIRERSIA